VAGNTGCDLCQQTLEMCSLYDMTEAVNVAGTVKKMVGSHIVQWKLFVIDFKIKNPMHVHCKLGLNSPHVCKASWGIILSQGSWILTFRRYLCMYLPHVAVSCHRRMESTTKLM